MAPFNFRKWDTILGWCAFAVALITYSLTVEPTMSFWDCGEYIPTAAKLEVGHPPGAPLFQMMGAFFSMFATSKYHIALMVNMVSVFSSAFTILLMFWSSTIILRRVVSQFTEIDVNHSIGILGASFIGALAYAFSDSFWFSAVEAEVYAMAMLLIALLLWLGLRWEQDMDTPRGNRWLLVICLVTGLSFGVHFMSILAIPSIGFLYYFKHWKKITIQNFIIANIVVVAILLFIFKLLLPWTMAFFGKTEILMVNTFGLPFNSGTIIAALLLIAAFYFGLRHTRKKQYVHLNTLILSILFIFIGFSTWMMLPIRANANTPINENKPSDAAELLAYYNREQYGVNPLFYGPQYSDMFAGLDKDHPYLDKAPNYERDYKTGTYIITNNWKNADQNTDDAHKAILPRMWSTDHAENYMNFTHVLNFRIDPNYDWESELPHYGINPDKLTDEEIAGAVAQLRGEMEKTVAEFRKAYANKEIDNEGYVKFLKSYGDYLIVDKPSAWDNISFMFEYQFGYMYWRYLMWNFTGRQNDIQGKYDNLDGNWLSGVKPIDEMHLGSQSHLTDDMLRNKGRNLYFFLPFILGVIGLVFHANKDLKSFYVLLALFLFTGIALKIYLNERPFEPRERDYALVGSFMVFAMWVGFGVYAVYDYARRYIQPRVAVIATLGLTLFAAPILMASQNWDDHDRSNRYTSIAMAKNYLNSCDKNAVLFTIGDNDTFPLWYAQEIEGVRPDVKICCTSLLMTDWYTDQMKCRTYSSEGMDISFSHNDYVGDKLDYTAYIPRTEERYPIKKLLDFIRDPRTTYELPNGQSIHFFPTDKIRIPVDKDQVIKYNVVNPKYNDSIVPYIDVDIKSSALYKNRLMMLDFLANNNWKRPIYFTGGSFDDDDYLWMKDYLQLDGMVYKLVPVKTPVAKSASPLDMGQIDADKMYNLVMKFDWGNGEDPKIYQDPETRKNSITYRTNLSRLMEQLINEGKREKAKKVIDLAMAKMPVDLYGYYTMLDPFIAGYYELGETGKARALAIELIKKYQQELDFFNGMELSQQSAHSIDIMTDIERYRSLIEVMKDRNDMGFFEQQRKAFNNYNHKFKRFGREDE